MQGRMLGVRDMKGFGCGFGNGKGGGVKGSSC